MSKPVTFANAHFIYYDLESLEDVFSLAMFDPRNNIVEIFYLVDPGTKIHQDITQIDPQVLLDNIQNRVLLANPAYTKNDQKPRQVRVYDLAHLNTVMYLGSKLGVSDADSVNNPYSKGSIGDILRPVCDTDPGYDPFEAHPYYCGYNSYHYDTTMIALFFAEAFETEKMIPALFEKNIAALQTNWVPVKAKYMRQHNDQLFSGRFKEFGMASYLSSDRWAEEGYRSFPATVRRNMLSSGRHLDVSRFNESNSMVALKRLLGGQGRQILESDKLSGHNARINSLDEFYDLLAYNVSDVIGLAKIAALKTYSTGFDLKKGLLDQYPETIYAKHADSYTPNISPTTVRPNRLTPDSTSAKFVSLILSPYGRLTDYKTVSFLYPHKTIADQMGIEQQDVLDECRRFFEQELMPIDTPAKREAYAQFMHIYNYYRSIEGKNFNDSPEYAEDYGNVQAHYLPGIPKLPNNIPYFRKDGTPTTGFATFSVGGIHGAEYNLDAYNEAIAEYNEQQSMIDLAKASFSSASEFLATAKEQHNRLYLPDGSYVDKGLVLFGSNPLTVRYRKPKSSDPIQVAQLEKAQAAYPNAADLLATQREASQALDVVLDDGQVIIGKKVLQNTTVKNAAWRDTPSVKKPALFVPTKKNDGSTILNSKFNYTSVGQVIHEDFSSYYPNLLRNMNVFYNKDLGEDRYASILADKDRYQMLAKQAREAGDTDAEERFNLLRNGTKLILNAASGAGDTNFAKQPIRVNNAIISMRLIGQCFSWRIGQAQTFAGGTIVSTNTDGLYSLLDESTGFTQEINNAILEQQAQFIHVPIEPEPLLLVSKDANNRLEMKLPNETTLNEPPKIISVSGGTLACYEGPRPEKNLAHPSVIDWALANYLRQCAVGHPDVNINELLNLEFGTKLLEDMQNHSDKVHAVNSFGHVIAASAGMWTFPFASNPVAEGDDTIVNHKALQHYNRVLFVNKSIEDSVSLRAAGAWAISPATALRRKKENLAPVAPSDPVALDICRANGFVRTLKEAEELKMNQLPTDRDIAIRKISMIEPHWNALITNQDLHCLTNNELDDLLDSLDINVYLQLLQATFNKNWSNAKKIGR